jgi:hypothetical protein
VLFALCEDGGSNEVQIHSCNIVELSIKGVPGEKGHVQEMSVSAYEHGTIRKAVSRFLSPQASALGIGFTGLILLMAVMAIDITRSLRDVEVTTAALRTESRERGALLDQVGTELAAPQPFCVTTCSNLMVRAQKGRGGN